jgi:hypothetical protein
VIKAELEEWANSISVDVIVLKFKVLSDNEGSSAENAYNMYECRLQIDNGTPHFCRKSKLFQHLPEIAFKHLSIDHMHSNLPL